MTKMELYKKVAADVGTPTKPGIILKAIDAVIKTITSELAAGNDVELKGFGTFKVVSRAQRKGHNPRTGEEIIIPACKTPYFKPSKILKAQVNAA